MAPSRKQKGKGKALEEDEGESSGRNVRGPNAYKAPPLDPNLRPVIWLGGFSTFDAGHPEKTKQVVRIVSQEVRQHYPGPYTRYTDFPENNKKVIQAEFLKHYQFEPNVNLTEAWNTFRRVADGRLQDMLNKCRRVAKKKYGDSIIEWKERGAAPRPYDSWIKPSYWPNLVDYWCSDAFAIRSMRNASNRANVEGSGATTGSVNMLVHKQRFELKQGREPRWSDELFQPTHTKKKTGEYINVKAKNAQLKYENAMTKRYGADREKWPNYDSDIWYSTGIDDQNIHGDNYGLGALASTRRMFRSGDSSSTQSRSSQSYSSMPPAPQLTEEDIDRISARVAEKLEARMEARWEARFRAASGGSDSHQALPPSPQDDEDDDEDDDEGQWSDGGGDGTT